MRRPLQNRVMPTGEIVANPMRGLFMGNRGILHDETGQLGRSRWKHPHWVCCRLAFKGRRRRVMAPGAYTELFFLDEAVALAAGHRPCAECRRDDFNAFRAAWEAAFGQRPRAPEMDRVLHPARVRRDRGQVRHEARCRDLPAGAFFLDGAQAMLATEGAARAFAPEGYGAARPRPAGDVCVLTPRPVLALLDHGYSPQLHPSAAL